MKYFLLLMTFLVNCVFTTRTNFSDINDKEIQLKEKIKIKIIVPEKSPDSDLAKNIKKEFSSNPNIETVETFRDSEDSFHYGEHKNTLIVRLLKENKDESFKTLWYLTLGIFPKINTAEFPSEMQFYDEQGNSEYLTGVPIIKESKFNSWLAVPLFPINLFMGKVNHETLAVSSIHTFLDSSLNKKLIRSAGSSEKLISNPKLEAEKTKWVKEYSWKETLRNEDKNLIDRYDVILLEKFIKEDKLNNYNSYYALQRLAGIKMQKGDFSGAANSWRTYQSKFPNKRAEISEIISLLNEKENSQIKNLGSDVNSSAEEYLINPEVSGRKLYFTANSRSGGSGGEDVWESNLIEETSKWSKAKPVNSLNDSGNQAPIAVSPDGTELSLFGSYQGSLGGGDIFQSKLTSNGWDKPVNAGRPINSEYFDSDICFSSDGSAILFASDRPAGYYPFKKKDSYYAGSYWGNTDIYVVLKKEDGSFSSPRNLGTIINTPGAERTPFLHPDGKTLYFSSNSHNGFGELDIFKTVRLDDTWQNWSKPVNLGKSLNSYGMDWGFKMTAASSSGFFSAVLKDTIGGSDLYEIIPLPNKAKPAGEVVAIYGKILDENLKALEADVVWQDLKTGKTIGQLKSKATTGEFYITLPVGAEYAYYATIPGYLNQSQKIDLRKDKKFREVKFEMQLLSIDSVVNKGTEIALNNIIFEVGKDILRKESFAELDRLISIMRDFPKIKIEIQGHTSSELGIKEETNLDLSNRRAKSVFNYLISKGIATDRLSSKGYGSSKPTANNDTEENRIKNRRVSFTVSKE